MSSDVPQAVIERLKKLLAMKERPGSEGEAANAAMLIQNLCNKHNVDINILERPEEQEAITKGLEFTQRLQTYDLDLAHAVDAICDTKHFITVQRKRVVFMKKGKPDFKLSTFKSIVFIGLPANVETAALVWNYLDAAIYAMLDARFKKGQVKGLSDHRAYRMGAALRLQEICRQKKEEYVQQIEGDQCRAVVLMSQSIAQDALDYMQQTGNLKGTHQANGSVGRSWGAYSLGHHDGEKIDPNGARTSKMLT